MVALRRALFGVGPIATGRAIVRRLRRSDAEAFRTEPAAGGKPHPFDTEFGVDAGGFVSWRDLQSGGANDPYISGYIGIAPSIGRQVLSVVERPDAFVFVDFGCGKGRALIVASELPFRRVVGVEISAPLAAAAQRNAEAIRARFPDRPPIEVVHGDAAAFELPPDPVVIFLYQPFEAPVMRQVLRRLEASLRAAPRPAMVIYLYPNLARLFDRSPLLERAGEGSLRIAPEDVPYAYGGRDSIERYIAWRTRSPRP